MIYFLGNLGIDRNLFFAQLINFAVLAWFLSYFVYKPTIGLIEKNETELAEGEKMRDQLDKDKSDFAAQKEREMSEVKMNTRKTAEEMRLAAEKIKRQSYEKAERESAALVGQTKEALESQKPMLERELARDLKRKMDEHFRESFDASIEPQYRKEFQAVLFKILIGRIHAMPLEEIGGPDASGNIAGNASAMNIKNKKEYQKKLRQKIGIIFLEHAAPLSPWERAEVEKIVSDKIGLKIKVEPRQNKNLVNGFRLEIMGKIIESNVSTIIENAHNN